jgi:hypothetical protein
MFLNVVKFIPGIAGGSLACRQGFLALAAPWWPVVNAVPADALANIHHSRLTGKPVPAFFAIVT